MKEVDCVNVVDVSPVVVLRKPCRILPFHTDLGRDLTSSERMVASVGKGWNFLSESTGGMAIQGAEPVLSDLSDLIAGQIERDGGEGLVPFGGAGEFKREDLGLRRLFYRREGVGESLAVVYERSSQREGDMAQGWATRGYVLTVRDDDDPPRVVFSILGDKCKHGKKELGLGLGAAVTVEVPVGGKKISGIDRASPNPKTDPRMSICGESKSWVPERGSREAMLGGLTADLLEGVGDEGGRGRIESALRARVFDSHWYPPSTRQLGVVESVFYNASLTLSIVGPLGLLVGVTCLGVAGNLAKGDVNIALEAAAFGTALVAPVVFVSWVVADEVSWGVLESLRAIGDRVVLAKAKRDVGDWLRSEEGFRQTE